MIQIWVVGRRAGPASLCGALSQISDVVLESQVLIPKESHLLDQLVHPVLRRDRRWLWWVWGFISPSIVEIFHLSYSCSCDEPAHCRPGVIPGMSGVRWRIGHWSGVFPVWVFGVISGEDGFPII